MTGTFNAETLKAALDAAGLKASLRFFDTLGSTNDLARDLLLDKDVPEWTVIVADAQTAGHGRMNRAWLAPAGDTVCMSVVLRPTIEPAHLPRLTMLGALATLRTLRRWFDADALGLKWPNDVLLHGRKVAGILPEGSFVGAVLRGAVLGIGINVGTDFSAHPDLAASAISMQEAAPGVRFDRVAVLTELLRRLEEAYPRLESQELFNAWRDALVILGRQVIVTTPDGAVRGIAETVSPEGALWLRSADGHRQRFLAGDVSLRDKDG